MGEYAVRRRDGVRVKMGTCEDMFYLRWEDRASMQAEAGIIARAMSEEYGLCTPYKPSLTALKRRMEGGM